MLIELFALLSVPLRALAFVSQALSVGGIAFILLLAVPLAARVDPARGSDLLRGAGRITVAAGVAAALVATARIVSQLTELVVEAGIPIGEALGAGFVAAWGAQAAAGLAIAALLARRRAPPGPAVMACLAMAALVVVAGGVATSHAVGRLEGGPLLAAATALHGLAAAVWIGGLPCFLAALACAGDDGVALGVIGRRYSIMSMWAVAVLAGAGGLLAIAYVGSWAALYGTAYGLMAGVKVVLFLLLLGLGAANYRVVEALRRDPATPALRLRRFAEVELGIGIAVFFAAASLTSAPPAVDVAADRVTMAELAERAWPPAPRLRPPRAEAIRAAAAQVPSDRQGVSAPGVPGLAAGRGTQPHQDAAGAAWAEYEHDWAGVFLLVIGILAIAERRGVAFGRHWPLLLPAFAAFLVMESDPGIRLLGHAADLGGAHGDAASQHLWRMPVALLLVVVGLGEWGIRSGLIQDARAALLLPLTCAGVALMLLAHGHGGSAATREVLPVAMSHSLLAVLALAAGGSRWIELRMQGTSCGRAAGRILPICLMALGLVLVGYREAP